MLLCLVYHKVVTISDHRSYQVSARTLSEHIELLQRSGIQFVQPENLTRAEKEPGVCVMLTFDDATADHASTVDEILQLHGISAVFFVPTAKLGVPGRLTKGDVRRLSEHGNLIGSHGHTHRRMDTMTPEVLTYELDVSSKIISDCVGKKPTFFAPPGGFANARVYSHAYERGFRYVRTMQWGYNRDYSSRIIKVLPMDIFLSAMFLQWGMSQRNERLLTLLHNLKEQMKQGFTREIYERFRHVLSQLTT
jgi:peptidoglycan/xylan/chitin deacetylase (PgdA/CDA1 family)